MQRKFEQTLPSIGHLREKLDVVSQRTIVAVGEKRDVARDIMNDCHGCSGQTLSEKMGCTQGEKLLHHED